MKLSRIYKRDVAGDIRIWQAEVGEIGHEGCWRTHSGILGGTIITSEWKYAEPKSKVNSDEQAIFNAAAEMNKKLKGDYKLSIDKIDENRNSMIRPMLANDYVGWIGKCFSQPKLDGMRCLANIDGLWSRNNRKIISTPHIEGVLKIFFQTFPHLILDGELYNHDLNDNFNLIMSLCKKTRPDFEDLERSKEIIQYWIFDMYNPDGPDMIYLERWMFLQEQLFNIIQNKSLVSVPTIYIQSEMDLNMDFATLLERGFEGQIVRLNTAYEQKRTSNLLKRKEFVDQEYELIDIEEGAGNWEGYAKRAICEDANGKRFAAGISGTQDFCARLLIEKDKYTTVTVKYHALTPDGVPRFPIAIKFWEGQADAIEERIVTKKKDLFG